MRFVGDHCEPPALQRRVFPDLVEREREGLHRHRDDQLFVLQCCCQQTGFRFGARLADVFGADRGHDLRRPVDLPYRVLQLPIEHGAVDNDDHRVEDFLVVHVQPRQPVCGPGDGVRLARSCRVLDQVALAHAFLSHRGYHVRHGFPLVEPGEEHACTADRRSGRHIPFLFGLYEHQPADDGQPGVLRPDPLPQVRRGRPPGLGWRVSCAAFVADIEGQKVRFRAFEPGGHRSELIRDREMHQRPMSERQQWLWPAVGHGVAVLAVLDDGVVERLVEVGFHFHGGDREAVDEEH